jgi:hypothetical protein
MTKPNDAGGSGRPPAMPNRSDRPAPPAERSSPEAVHGVPEGPRQYPPAEAARPLSSGPGAASARNAMASAAEQTHLTSEAKEQAADLAGRAQHQVSTLMTDQKNRAAQRLDTLAGALRDVADRLGRDEVGRGVGHYAQRAAAQVDSMSSYLRGAELEAVMRDTGQFARRRPEVFIGGAFLAGLLTARFLKASSGRRSPDGSRGGY